ncbi:ubiquitin-protein ligase e3a-related [Anaeramoeba flamelloides]|uniref:Ubiquitin-protein ligase e3a-related n=1 Tax=Anaeramoeba flamelloides TaxID=1746091 RepID=A0ABQ8XGX4_9EUKA|nr:ubiquitin-protein ligase e3a-related [Anaeramoeba flamelloides]
MDQKIYAFGVNSNGQLISGHNSPVTTVVSVDLPFTVLKISCETNRTFLLTIEKGLLLVDFKETKYKSTQWTELQLPFNTSQVREMKSGHHHTVLLTWDGEVIEYQFNYGRKNTQKYEEYGNYFFDLGTQVKKICCGEKFTLYLCRNNEVYIKGNTMQTVLPIKLQRNRTLNKNVPIWLRTNVQNVYTSCSSKHFFLTIYNNGIKLLGCGLNLDGQLGLGHFYRVDKLNEIQIGYQQNKQTIQFNMDEIQDIQCSAFHSTLLTKSGKLFVTGYPKCAGYLNSYNRWVMIPALKNTIIKQIAIGKDRTLAVTNNNKVLLWGDLEQNGPYLKKLDGHRCQALPNSPFQFKKIINSHDIQIVCGFQSSFVIGQTLPNNTINLDLLAYWKNQFFLNSHKFFNYQVDKRWVEFRTNLDLETLKKKLIERNCNNLIIGQILQCVFSGICSSQEIQSLCMLIFEKRIYTQKSAREDFKKFYNFNESKDFFINVIKKNKSMKNEKENNKEIKSILCTEINSNSNDELNEKLNDENMMEKIEKNKKCKKKIKVHKFILFVRSGLFRVLFQDITQSILEINDYCKNSRRSLELLIEFLYTGEFNLKKQDDLKKILFDLQDSVEYYQLSESSEIWEKLELIESIVKRKY